LDVFGRRYSASMHMRRIIVATNSRPIAKPSPRCLDEASHLSVPCSRRKFHCGATVP
jgi:hypothetical protein